jgi:hypothetical protein
VVSAAQPAGTDGAGDRSFVTKHPMSVKIIPENDEREIRKMSGVNESGCILRSAAMGFIGSATQIHL